MPYYVISTFSSREACRRIAREAVNRKLAACASMLDNVTSVYWWKQRVEEAREILVIFKVSDEKLMDLNPFLEKEHEYDTPEIVSLKMDKINRKYLEWINSSLQENAE